MSQYSAAPGPVGKPKTSKNTILGRQEGRKNCPGRGAGAEQCHLAHKEVVGKMDGCNLKPQGLGRGIPEIGAASMDLACASLLVVGEEPPHKLQV